MWMAAWILGKRGGAYNAGKQGMGISFWIFPCACWEAPSPRTDRFTVRRTHLTAWLFRFLRSLVPAHPRGMVPEPKTYL